MYYRPISGEEAMGQILLILNGGRVAGCVGGWLAGWLLKLKFAVTNWFLPF